MVRYRIFWFESIGKNKLFGIINVAEFRPQRGTYIKRLIWPPLRPKTENCFSQISYDLFIRRMTEVLNFGIYLNFTVAMVTKMADKIGLK